MRNINPAFWTDLEECVDIVECCIRQRMQPRDTMKEIVIKLGSRFRTMQNIFATYTPHTIGSYIRRRTLTETYYRYKKEKPSLALKSTYKGIKCFLTKFYNEFGCYPEGVADESYLQEKYDVDELRKAYELLADNPLVKDYRYSDGNIILDYDDTEILKFYLNLPSFLLPVDMLSELEKYDAKQQVVVLYLVTNALKYGTSGICISFDCLEKLLAARDFYDLNNKVFVNESNLIIAPRFPAEFRNTYDRIADELLPYVELAVPTSFISTIDTEFLQTVSDARFFDDIEKRLKIEGVNAKDLMWEYLKLGYLRLNDKALT